MIARRLACAVLLVGTVQVAAAGELYPLTVGSWWTYKVSGENYTEATNRIAESGLIGSKTWYRLIDHGETFWVRNGPEGQVEAMALFGTDADQPVDALDETLVFKYPVSPGTVYPLGEAQQVSVVGERTLTTGGREFTCIQYVIEMDGDFAAQCITPGVGPVEIEVSAGGRRSVSRLVDYHIAP